MIDMTQNRVPYGLLTDEEKVLLEKHEAAGGTFIRRWPHSLSRDGLWQPCVSVGGPPEYVYRTVPLPLTQDEIAWERLPAFVEWVARDASKKMYMSAYEMFCPNNVWSAVDNPRRFDDFPGIVIKRGTCDWKDSKQRRPK